MSALSVEPPVPEPASAALNRSEPAQPHAPAGRVQPPQIPPAQDHLYLVVVGHVDHGKSTLIGRLLFDTQSVPEGKAEQIQAACKAEGMEFEYAFLMDALLEEQAQNITMDTTRVPFRTPRRAYTIIDAPGHKEFLKNMITGAASADAAVLLVDAHEGVREQTRRHAYLLSLLGLKQVVVAVNKMDLVGYDHSAFEAICSELGRFLSPLGVKPAHYVPISAKLGVNLLRAGPEMPWNRGPALLEALELFRTAAAPAGGPLRLSVQDVYRFDARRIVAGLVESGTVSAGDPIEFSPGGKRSRVKSIEAWPVSGRSGGAVGAGRSVAITLEDELFVERGQVGAPPSALPSEARVFVGRIFWLHPEPLKVGEVSVLRLGTQQADARLVAVQRTLDVTSLEGNRGPTDEVRRHEVAEVRLRVRRPIACDAGGAVPPLGRFVLMKGRRIAGGGVIDAVLREESQATRTAEGPAARAALLGHQGAVLWMTGLSGSGKSTLSHALEGRLLRAGVLAAVLDGDVLRQGLSKNLGFSDTDRRENLRRATELALHLADAGVVVIGALISPFRADRAAVAERARERGIPFAEIFVNAPLSECERRDPKQLYKKARAGRIPLFTGIDSPYEAPLAPDLELKTDRQSVEESVDLLTELAVRLTRLPEDAESEGSGANI